MMLELAPGVDHRPDGRDLLPRSARDVAVGEGYVWATPG
jgi:hypothetical protein